MPYVDGYLLVVPKKSLPTYRRLATKAGKIWREYGALEFRECVADDLKTHCGTPYLKLLKLKPSETAMFSWIVFRSKKDRDRINNNVMSDPRLTSMDVKSLPFDAKKMSWGGFKILVDL